MTRSIYEYTENEQYPDTIGRFIERDGYLYVFYPRAGVMKVFEDDHYLRSFACYVKSGEISLCADEDYVYIRDYQDDFFAFSKGENVETIDFETMSARGSIPKDVLSSERKKTQGNNQKSFVTEDKKYYIQKGSLYMENQDGKTTLIEKVPLFNLLFYSTYTFYLIAFLMILTLMSFLAVKIKKEKDE